MGFHALQVSNNFTYLFLSDNISDEIEDFISQLILLLSFSYILFLTQMKQNSAAGFAVPQAAG